MVYNLEFPDNKVHGANMGPIWGRQDPRGPHYGPVNFAIWVYLQSWRWLVHQQERFYTLVTTCIKCFNMY